MSKLPTPRELAHDPLAASSQEIMNKRHYFYQESIIYFSIFQSPIVRLSASKLMPTLMTGKPLRANLEA